MRSLCVSFALLAAFAIPTAARADNFVIGGGVNAPSLPSSPASQVSLFTDGASDPRFNTDAYTLLDQQGLPYGMVTMSKTNEPKSFFLLGTGALGLLGFSRRRPRL